MTYVKDNDEPSEPSRLGSARYRYVDRLLGGLVRITAALRVAGIATLIVTITNLGTLLIVALNEAEEYRSGLGTSSYVSANYSSDTLYPNMLLTILAITLLATVDILRRRGNSAFQEVSDQLQRLSGDEEADEELVPRARYAIRSFASAAELPLVPGRFGPAAYVLINLITMGLSVYFYTRFHYS